MNNKLSKRIETMLKKSEIILSSGKHLRVPRVRHMVDSNGFTQHYFCGECHWEVETYFKYCPYCGKLLYW